VEGFCEQDNEISAFIRERERERERSSCTIFQRQSGRWRSFGRCITSCEARIDMDFKEINWNGVD
jgi:hypothetical protein